MRRRKIEVKETNASMEIPAPQSRDAKIHASPEKTMEASPGKPIAVRGWTFSFAAL